MLFIPANQILGYFIVLEQSSTSSSGWVSLKAGQLAERIKCLPSNYAMPNGVTAIQSLQKTLSTLGCVLYPQSWHQIMRIDFSTSKVLNHTTLKPVLKVQLVSK